MQQADLKTAREISEYLIKVTADALMQRDFESFSKAFGLPQKVTTAGREITFETLEDLQTAFTQMCEHYDSIGMTELRRICEAAEFHGPDRVEATHTSYVIGNGRALIQPYPVYSVLERINGNWVVTAADYALNDNLPLAQAMNPCHMTSIRAMKIYQEHLDLTAKSMMTCDFSRFRERVALPHNMRTQTATQIVTTWEEMRKVFRRFADKYHDIGMTDFLRIAKQAYFHAEDDIRGVHESHLIRNGTRLSSPYLNRVRLKLFPDGAWRETHCTNAILNGEGRFHLWAEVADKPHLPDLEIDPERTPK